MKPAKILLWAVFLGASWTWCIGMFLPVLLVRDYGAWGWVVFAIPNVIGAAAMAWVLPNAAASAALVRDHRLACQMFSFVTLAFQAFFVVWIHRQFPQLDWAADAVLFAALFVLALRFAAAAGISVALAVAVSAVAAIWMAADHTIPHLPPAAGNPGWNLAWLAMVCALGFSLCPYLDLTFHQARQATTPAEGKAAFALGFGAVFFAMIVFTLGYSGWLVWRDAPLANYIAVPIGNHLLYQIGLKFVLHGRAVTQSGGAGSTAAALAAAVAGAAAGIILHDHFELGYRFFMAFYGLVFPAYVWIAVFGKRPPALWLAAVLLATPAYYAAFIDRRMAWAPLGVAIVLLARFVRPTITAKATA